MVTYEELFLLLTFLVAFAALDCANMQKKMTAHHSHMIAVIILLIPVRE